MLHKLLSLNYKVINCLKISSKRSFRLAEVCKVQSICIYPTLLDKIHRIVPSTSSMSIKPMEVKKDCVGLLILGVLIVQFISHVIPFPRIRKRSRKVRDFLIDLRSVKNFSQKGWTFLTLHIFENLFVILKRVLFLHTKFIDQNSKIHHPKENP